MHEYTLERRIAAFWKKVDKSGGADTCWLWTGAIKNNGYGNFNTNKRTIGAHRFSYAMAHGEIPDGLHVLHRCDNRACVNPAHLFLGTQGDNMRDMSRKGRNSSQTHPERLRHGEDHPHSKFTEDQVRDIRRRYAAGGISQPQLAKEYGVNHSAIGAIVRGEVWKTA